MKNSKGLLGLIILFSVLIWSCKKESVVEEPDVVLTQPTIKSLSATKDTINFGGEDPTLIICDAEGGNLKYLWEVDLGDIIPQNEIASEVSFTGSLCCIGDKTIKCTVTNEKGSVEKTINVFIREP